MLIIGQNSALDRGLVTSTCLVYDQQIDNFSHDIITVDVASNLWLLLSLLGNFHFHESVVAFLFDFQAWCTTRWCWSISAFAVTIPSIRSTADACRVFSRDYRRLVCWIDVNGCDRARPLSRRSRLAIPNPTQCSSGPIRPTGRGWIPTNLVMKTKSKSIYCTIQVILPRYYSCSMSKNYIINYLNFRTG